jgi:tellurite resistance protein TerC
MDAARQLFFDSVARSHQFVDAAAGPAWASILAVAAFLVASLDPILYGELFGRPGWMWLSFVGIVVLLLAFDLGVLHRKSREIEVGESLILSAGYICVALAFGFWVWRSLGDEAGMAYLTGFLVEKSLAMDNVFVIAMILGYFAIPRQYHHFEFQWVLYLFGVFLVATGIKMLLVADKEHSLDDNPLLRFLRSRFRVTEQLHGERFFVRLPDPASGRSLLWVTPLFLALVLIEIADLVFAVDSVPAIFAITQDPFIVYTSNIFAVLGLRALYFALAAMIHRFRYLKYALALVLVFIGTKIFMVNIVGKIPPAFSLSVTLSLLVGGVLFSLWRTAKDEPGPTPRPT